MAESTLPWRWIPWTPTVLVVDASVLVVGLLDDGPAGRSVRARLRGEQLVAPSHSDLEVISAWRGLARSGRIRPERLQEAVADLQDLPVRRIAPTALLARCWELRDNVTPYDAAYVVLAEVLEATLLTADARLARASGPRCAVEVADLR